MTIRSFSMLMLTIMGFYLTACSPINSMAPFDDKQAAIVAASMMPPRLHPAK